MSLLSNIRKIVGGRIFTVDGDSKEERLKSLERQLEQARRIGDSNEVKDLQKAIEDLKKGTEDGLLEDVIEGAFKMGGLTEDAQDSFSIEEAQKIGETVGVDFNEVDLEQFRIGLGVELEHSDLTAGDPSMTAKIALAHLREIPDYYTRLEKMESGVEKETVDSGRRELESYKGYRIYRDEDEDMIVAVRSDGDSINGYNIKAVKAEIDKKPTKDADEKKEYVIVGKDVYEKGGRWYCTLPAWEISPAKAAGCKLDGGSKTKDAMRMTNDPGERGKQKEMLRGLYPDYDPKHHDAFVARYNKEEDKKNTAEYMKNRGISDNKTKDCKSVKQRFRDAIKKFRDAKSDYITAVDPNGKEMEIGESMANALVQSGAARWSEDHKKVILDKPITKDGGVGSGIKGHVTAKQMAAMKARKAGQKQNKAKYRQIEVSDLVSRVGGLDALKKKFKYSEDVYDHLIDKHRELVKENMKAGASEVGEVNRTRLMDYCDDHFPSKG
jgi:hypothetical protein